MGSFNTMALQTMLERKTQKDRTAVDQVTAMTLRLNEFQCKNKKCGGMNYCKCKCTRCQNDAYRWWNRLSTCGRCFGRKRELQTCDACKGSHKKLGKRVKDLCPDCKYYIRESAPRWPEIRSIHGVLPSEILKAIGGRRRLTHRRDSPVMLRLIQEIRRANERHLAKQRCKAKER